MNYVIWDIETDSAQLDWATMIEVGAILLDENFKEKERFSARCRMPQDRVPSATALCINKSNVDLITKGNLSHYEMIAQLEKKFKEWSPATFMGFSSVGFDDEILRREFFKSLRKPYLINTEGNSRHDALNMIKAAFAVDENVLKTELNPKGNKSMHLATEKGRSKRLSMSRSEIPLDRHTPWRRSGGHTQCMPISLLLPPSTARAWTSETPRPARRASLLSAQLRSCAEGASACDIYVHSTNR